MQLTEPLTHQDCFLQSELEFFYEAKKVLKKKFEIAKIVLMLCFISKCLYIDK